MIDLHCHILSGLDDGPQTLDESIEMCRMGFQDGIKTIIATPHTQNGVYENDRPTILAKVKELNKAIKKIGIQETPCAIRNPQPAISLTVLPGADVSFSEAVLDHLKEGKAITVGDAGHYLLLEFPFQGIPLRAEEVLFRLTARGITPIISHPERNYEIARKPQRYHEMIRAGCLGQITAMSLTGGFGGEVKRAAQNLLKSRLVHFIASDAHSVNGRVPVLSFAVQAAARIVGEEEARKMVTEYPQAILEGRRPKVPEPIIGDRR
jgi:protein-tyrosine phosphatase